MITSVVTVLDQVIPNRFNMTETPDTPLEVLETEGEMAAFLRKGVSMITREGDNLRLAADADNLVFSMDKKCQELLARP